LSYVTTGRGSAEMTDARRQEIAITVDEAVKLRDEEVDLFRAARSGFAGSSTVPFNPVQAVGPFEALGFRHLGRVMVAEISNDTVRAPRPEKRRDTASRADPRCRFAFGGVEFWVGHFVHGNTPARDYSDGIRRASRGAGCLR
jgi:hypothetical protein